MPVDPLKYIPPYVSEINREVDGDLDDCALSAGIALAAVWTGGEILFKQDGTPRNVIDMREARVKALGPGKKAGGLTLPDVNQFLHWFDETLPDLPYYPFQKPYDGTLRLSFDQFWEKLQGPYAAILLGNPSRVKNPASRLRTKQGNDDYGHAIFVWKARNGKATVYDALTRNKPDWQGERIPKEELAQFASAFGQPDAIGCAVIQIGSATKEARARQSAKERESRIKAAHAAVEKVYQDNIRSLEADLVSANDRIAILESAQSPDLTAVKREARQSFKDEVLAIPA